MRLLPLLRSLTIGLCLGYAGWQGVEYLLDQGRPARLYQRAVAESPEVPISGLTATILFRPDECPRSMSVLELLNNLSSSQVRVVGALMVEEYRMPDWRLLVRAERIHFPVYRLDPRKALAAIAGLGYSSGPLLVVFDRAGRVVLATDQFEGPDFKAFLAHVAQRFTSSPNNRRIRA